MFRPAARWWNEKKQIKVFFKLQFRVSQVISVLWFYLRISIGYNVWLVLLKCVYNGGCFCLISVNRDWGGWCDCVCCSCGYWKTELENGQGSSSRRELCVGESPLWNSEIQPRSESREDSGKDILLCCWDGMKHFQSINIGILCFPLWSSDSGLDLVHRDYLELEESSGKLALISRTMLMQSRLHQCLFP